MSAHVLLNLLNEFGKGDKILGLPSILSLFGNEFNKFNKTRALMIDSILTHTANAKCFRNVTLINIRGLVVIIVPFRGYGRISSNQVVNKRECMTDKFLLSFS